MKPLLILPPAPTRWAALESLLDETPPARLDDARRFCVGVSDAHDAFAVQIAGGQALACGAIARRGRVGVLTLLCTRPDHRGRGLAGKLIDTLLGWFDMSGGRTLCHLATAAAAESLAAEPGWRVVQQRGESAVLIREVAAAAAADHNDQPTQTPPRRLTRADWPLLVELLLHGAGPDPRLAADEVALGAEDAALEWINAAERGTAELLGTNAAVGCSPPAASGWTPSGRTYGMCFPRGVASEPVRAGLSEVAARRGYTRVDYPLEALAEA